MPISERLLRKWRKDVLKEDNDLKLEVATTQEPRSELRRKILVMTSELLDQHLLRK